MPRVAVYSEVGHPESTKISGVSNFLGYMRGHWKKNSWPMDFFCYADCGNGGVMKDGSVTVHGVRPSVPVEIDSGVYFDLAILLGLFRPEVMLASRSKDYDVVFLATPGSMGITGREVAKRRKLPAIAPYTTDIPRYVRPRFENLVQILWGTAGNVGHTAENLTASFEWWFYKKDHVDLVLAPTQRVADELTSKLSAAEIAVWGRGVDTALFTPSSSNNKPSKNEQVVILYSGRIHDGEKNVSLLGRMAPCLGDACFRIVGEGPDKGDLERMLGERAEFTGRLSGQALAEAYRTADILAFPSLTETYGQVVQEAHAAGLPAVVMNAGGVPELVDHGVTGFIANNEQEFSYFVQQLVHNPILRSIMGTDARRSVERKSWDAAFTQLCEHMERAIKNHGARQR